MSEKKITLDYSFLYPYISDNDIENAKQKSLESMRTLKEKNGKGNEFLGWISLPENMLKSIEFEEIESVALEINKNADLLVCIGIGGSYLGAKAILEALLPPFHNMQDKERRSGPKVIFAGQNISGRYHESVLNEIELASSVYVIVISKSGTTTEPGISFRLIREKIEKKYGHIESSKRIIAVTDAHRGALKTISDKSGYRTFIIPDDIGGRFSVFTPVGLLPIAAVGIDIKKLLKGALDQSQICKEENPSLNPALMYAILRNILLNKGYITEIMVNYEPALHFISEWWKQLYGESEGKDGKGIFTASVDFTTDLHSLGQMIQDGQRIMFETILNIESEQSNLKVNKLNDNTDDLEYLAGKKFEEINKMALKGTMVAHYDGKVPNMIFNIPEMNSYYIGKLLYLFEFACGISGYTLGVNPFDQPGVEEYKNNMFALLEKPGEKHKNNKDILNTKLNKIPTGKVTR